jgi:dihydrodipicolinate synthase/N-acetylneuraminate lyase
VTYPTIPDHIYASLADGVVIPAHPLALTPDREVDVKHQKALTRYYLDAGAGGIAIGVHTTQFQVREAGLYKSLLQLTREVIDEHPRGADVIRVAGVVGPTHQAVYEAEIARENGYHLALVSSGGLPDHSESQLVERVREVAKIIPVFGFYLQPAVGGRRLSYSFWRQLADIPNLYAIKIAPFDRYETINTVRAVLHADRWQEIALYTGNDDNIIGDLLTTFRVFCSGQWREKAIVGGLLGQWAVWTRRAVELLERIRMVRGRSIPQDLMELAWQLTDANRAIFDADNDFRGCIPGIHQILHEQGLLRGIWCLDPKETLSPGQLEEIARVRRDYPGLTDDEFVAEHLTDWLEG